MNIIPQSTIAALRAAATAYEEQGKEATADLLREAAAVIDATTIKTARVETAGTGILVALERYGFPVSDAASTASMSIEARNLHSAARRFKVALNSTGAAADEAAMTNGQ